MEDYMNHLFSTLRLCQRPYMNHMQRAFAPYQITDVQWGFIRYLKEVGPASNSEIAHYWGVEKPSVTTIAQKLVEQQLIELIPGEDKRVKKMVLTEKGLNMYATLRQVVDALYEELLQGVTMEEQQQLSALLTKLHHNLKGDPL